MSGNQNGKTEPKKANPGKIALIGAGGLIMMAMARS